MPWRQLCHRRHAGCATYATQVVGLAVLFMLAEEPRNFHTKLLHVCRDLLNTLTAGVTVVRPRRNTRPTTASSKRMRKTKASELLQVVFQASVTPSSKVLSSSGGRGTSDSDFLCPADGAGANIQCLQRSSSDQTHLSGSPEHDDAATATRGCEQKQPKGESNKAI